MPLSPASRTHAKTLNCCINSAAGNDSCSSGTATPQEIPLSSASSPETRLGKGEQATPAAAGPPVANAEPPEDSSCNGVGGAHAAWLSGREKAEELILVAFRSVIYSTEFLIKVAAFLKGMLLDCMALARRSACLRKNGF